MGLWDTIKGWFNIGGVKVKLEGVDPQVAKKGNQINGKVTLTSKGEKHVLKFSRNGSLLLAGGGRGAYQGKVAVFDIKTGEAKTLEFTIPYAIPETLADKGGVLGAVGKFGAFASGEKLEYYVVSVCDVKGTAFDPSDRVKVTVVDAK